MLNRKDFINVLFRSMILMGLMLITGVLVFRKSGNKIVCEFGFVCLNGNKLPSCSLPEADKLKEKKHF